MTTKSDLSEEVRIVAFGDSITQAVEQPEAKRWLTLVDQELKARFPYQTIKCINSGIGGETSREGLHRIHDDVVRHRPNTVIVGFGANDATQDPIRHVSREEFRQNLETIFRTVRDTLGAKVIIMSIVPIIDDWHDWMRSPYFEEYGGLDAYIERYRRVIREFCVDHGLALASVDSALRDEAQNRGPASVTLPDGVHLTEQGNRVVADHMFRLLLTAMEQSDGQ